MAQLRANKLQRVNKTASRSKEGYFNSCDGASLAVPTDAKKGNKLLQSPVYSDLIIFLNTDMGIISP